jgi:DNA modification methylase
MQYEEFISTKSRMAAYHGHDVCDDAIHESLFPFQRHIVRWACRKGRAAIFADTGLGKTRMLLEWARLMGQRTIVFAPLAVGKQIVKEAAKIGIDALFCQSESEATGQINVTNYESLHKFDASAYRAVVLDESSILKTYTGKTKQLLCKSFAETPYRLACTATPAPNDHIELGNHADFLGVLGSNEMLARWFTNDSMNAGQYRLKHHARTDFWRWVNSWAMSVTMPSDIGDFSDEGYVLPTLNLQVHNVDVDYDMTPEHGFFGRAHLNATELHKELRRTAPTRAAAVAGLVNESHEQWLVWCNSNYEADALTELIPDAVEVRGNDSIEKREAAFDGFTAGAVRVLVTKPSIAGFGLNWQHCRNAAFVGLSYSYEALYQAIRRSWRFGQTREVNCHIYVATTEGAVRGAIERKQKEHASMKEEMRAAARNREEAATGYSYSEQDATEGPGWKMNLGDCVDVARSMPDNCVGLTVHSPPFANLYIYSDDIRDMGNTADEAEFIRQYEFIIREMHRITIPGRLCAVHCKDLPRYKGRDGAAGLYDFPGDIVRAFERCGWQFHSRVTIWKCPVTEVNRTNNHGLLYKQVKRDSAASRQGMADYVLVFRKWTEEMEELAQPVTRDGERFCGYVGTNPPDQSGVVMPDRSINERAYSIYVWQRYASPVWFDIDQTNVLPYQQAKDDADERHICPLQLDVIERCIDLWSNPEDLVFSPFAGVGSEGYCALKMGRRFEGAELKPSYYRQAVKNLQSARSTQLELFRMGG